MIDSRGECKFGRLEGVVCGKVDVQKEHTALVRRLGWTQNSSLGLIALLQTFPPIGQYPTCQWKGSSPTGPAEHWAGGSLLMSLSSLLILLRAMVSTQMWF